MSSGRVGQAFVLACFFTAGYGRHRKLGVGFRTAGYGRHRSQWVKSNDTFITHGVPQGSVLGPLLFLLYINDFSRCSNVVDFHIFADDTNLFYSNSNLVELESIVNYNLKMVSDWLMVNKVSLNIDKTNFIIFHPPQKVKGHIVKLIISNREIMQERFIKYFGLLIDSHLSWKYHILHISKPIFRTSQNCKEVNNRSLTHEEEEARHCDLFKILKLGISIIFFVSK